MTLTTLFAWLIASADAATLAPPQSALVRVSGMDCAGCNREVAEALDAVPGVASVAVSFDEGLACATLDGNVESDALSTALSTAGFTAATIEAREKCPEFALPKKVPGLWDDVDGLDAAVVSTGDAVEIRQILVPQKYTVIDFGARWCGPCKISVATLKKYMAAHPDTAVRAIELEGDEPAESFALPVAKQFLAFAPGLPWFKVYGPTQKKIYEGGNIELALAAIDQKR